MQETYSLGVKDGSAFQTALCTAHTLAQLRLAFMSTSFSPPKKGALKSVPDGCHMKARQQDSVIEQDAATQR